MLKIIMWTRWRTRKKSRRRRRWSTGESGQVGVFRWGASRYLWSGELFTRSLKQKVQATLVSPEPHRMTDGLHVYPLSQSSTATRTRETMDADPTATKSTTSLLRLLSISDLSNHKYFGHCLTYQGHTQNYHFVSSLLKLLKMSSG